jgi:hypothetical protein
VITVFQCYIMFSPLFSSYFITVGLVLAVTLLSKQYVDAEKIETHSFHPPFEEIDGSGRVIRLMMMRMMLFC